MHPALEAGWDRVDTLRRDGEFAVPRGVVAQDPQSAEAAIGSLREYAAAIPVLSARSRRGLAGCKAARRLGVEKQLPKPCTRKELLAAVRESVRA